MLRNLLWFLVIQSLLSGVVYAHIPQGHSMKVTTQAGDYTVKVIVYPGIPEVNKTSEIIVGLINTTSHAPYNGSVRINGVPASDFSPGFYEINYIFREMGNASVKIEFIHGEELMVTTITVETKEASGPGKIFLGSMLVVIAFAFVSVGYLKKKKKE